MWGRSPSGFFVVDGDRIGYRDPAPRLGAAADRGATGLGPTPGRSMVTVDAAGRPYAGLRVVEFGVAGAVPEMARLLAEYGADAIRVESPERIDLFRQLGGPRVIGSAFVSSNRTTRSFGVDFTDPAGAQLVIELIKTADVVLENLPSGNAGTFRPRVRGDPRGQPVGAGGFQPDDGPARTVVPVAWLRLQHAIAGRA